MADCDETSLAIRYVAKHHKHRQLVFEGASSRHPPLFRRKLPDFSVKLPIQLDRVRASAMDDELKRVVDKDQRETAIDCMVGSQLQDGPIQLFNNGRDVAHDLMIAFRHRFSASLSGVRLRWEMSCWEKVASRVVSRQIHWSRNGRRGSNVPEELVPAREVSFRPFRAKQRKGRFRPNSVIPDRRSNRPLVAQARRSKVECGNAVCSGCLR